LCNKPGLSLSKENSKDDDGDFLLGGADLKQRAPRLDHQTLSLHLMDRGNGTRVLLTYHRMEDESAVNTDALAWGPKEMSEGGAVGRIVAGVRKKLQQVLVYSTF